MPTFGLDDPQLNGVINYFGAISNTVGPFQTHEVVPVASTEAAGKQLFELLKCQQCHVLGAIPKDQPTANLAPDLRMAPDRLQPDWILEWLKSPCRILPGTRMPAFWPDYPKSAFPQLNGDAEAQIRAIRDHLMTLRGGPSPRRKRRGERRTDVESWSGGGGQGSLEGLTPACPLPHPAYPTPTRPILPAIIVPNAPTVPRRASRASIPPPSSTTARR